MDSVEQYCDNLENEGFFSSEDAFCVTLLGPILVQILDSLDFTCAVEAARSRGATIVSKCHELLASDLLVANPALPGSNVAGGGPNFDKTEKRPFSPTSMGCTVAKKRLISERLGCSQNVINEARFTGINAVRLTQIVDFLQIGVKDLFPKTLDNFAFHLVYGDHTRLFTEEDMFVESEGFSGSVGQVVTRRQMHHCPAFDPIISSWDLTRPAPAAIGDGLEDEDNAGELVLYSFPIYDGNLVSAVFQVGLAKEEHFLIAICYRCQRRLSGSSMAVVAVFCKLIEDNKGLPPKKKHLIRFGIRRISTVVPRRSTAAPWTARAGARVSGSLTRETRSSFNVLTSVECERRPRVAELNH